MQPLAILNGLTVQTRKIIFAVIGAVMLIPILMLGRPADKVDLSGAPIKSGGTLAQLRFDYELGEASLGNVDPTSSAMSFGLLGFRGIVASMLWQEADDLKSRKEFAKLQDKVDSIIQLQPHFKEVWKFQGWNLAFNVSAECDDVKDRYKWVKNGAKFMVQGTERNRKVPELFWQTGFFFGNKLGTADEKEEYRRFFVSDPDETAEYFRREDPSINPERKGNYLVARDWYLKTNALVDAGREQHQMDSPLLLAYPYSALMEHAIVIQEDGVQLEGLELATRDEILEALAALSVDDPEKRKQLDDAYKAWTDQCVKAWQTAHDEWVREYGQKQLTSTDGTKFFLDILEPRPGDQDPAQRDREAISALAGEQGVEPQRVEFWRTMYRRTTNYPIRKQRCNFEQLPEMAMARANFTEGKRLYINMQDFALARTYLLAGLEKMAVVIDRYDRADGSNGILIDEPDVIESIIKTQILYVQSFVAEREPLPESFPLKDKIWDNPEPSIQAIKAQAMDAFQRIVSPAITP